MRETTATTSSRENEGFFFYLRDEYLSKTNEELNLEIKRILNALLESKVIKIDHDVLEKITSVNQATRRSIPVETVSLLTRMVMSMLEGELHRVNDEDVTYELGAEEIFDFNLISTTFKLDSRNEKKIKKMCLQAGWEVQCIKDLIVTVKKIKDVRKLRRTRKKKSFEPSQ